MAQHITHVHSPSDCDFCNRRTVGQSVPDLALALYGASQPSRSLIPSTPVSSPMRIAAALSPMRARGHRAKLARHRHHSRCTNSLNAATSLELLSRRQVFRPETSSETETPFRRRVYTMPSRPMESSESGSVDLYRLRSFSVTSRGSVLNLGDLMCFRSRSDFSATTSGEGSRCSLRSEDLSRDRAPSSSGAASVAQSDVPHYRVLVMGEEGVGKTSLIAQFMTSEYLTVRNAMSANEGQDMTGENATVSILLDGEEADLDCIETRPLTLSLEEFSGADIILMTYSVTHAGSFRSAVRALSCLRDLANSQPVTCLPLGPGLRSKAVILVGNKADLARVRTVTTEAGRSAASRYEVKFIETSVTIHHNVDELLVGGLSQVRLKARQAAALSCKRHAKFTSRAKNMWNRFVHKCECRFNSCDNLQNL